MSGKFSASIENTKKTKPTETLVKSDLPQISISLNKLPSKGLPYNAPKGASIQYRPYTFGEIKKISQSKLDVKSSFEFVCMGIETPFGIEELTIGDFFYLGLLRRISTLGSDRMMIPYNCRGCGRTSKFITETTQLDFEEISAPELPIIAEFTSRELEFHPLTLGDLYFLIEKDKHSDELSLLAKQCSNLEFEQAYDFINNANPEDSVLINEIDKLLYHSVKELEFNCKEILDSGKPCNHKNIIELDGGQALIMPFREHEESPRSRIHFGKPSSRKSSTSK